MTEKQATQTLITQQILQQEDQKRSFFSRAFSPIGEGSLRGIIFTLLASAMGTGIFNLPLRVQQIGVIAFLSFALLAAIFSGIGNLFITRLIVQNNFKSYSEMAYSAGGSILMRISNFCLIIYPWGITICFQVILAKFIVQLLNDVGGLNLYADRDAQIYNNNGNLTRILVNLSVVLVAIPLIMKKNIGVIQKLGMIGVIAVLFNILAIVITTFTGFTRTVQGQKIDYHGIFNLHKGQINWLTTGSLEALSLHAQGFASVLFCYVNHQLLFPLAQSLNRPTQKRFNKINRRSHTTQFFSYCLLAMTAYLLLVEHDDKYPIAPMVIVSIPTTLITIGKIAMCFALFFAIPLNMFPARQSIFETFQAERINVNYAIINFILIFTSCGIAITFQKVNSYFGLLGGTAGVLMSAAIPSICYGKLRAGLNCTDIILFVIVVIVTIMGFSGAILSVLDPS